MKGAEECPGFNKERKKISASPKKDLPLLKFKIVCICPFEKAFKGAMWATAKTKPFLAIMRYSAPPPLMCYAKAQGRKKGFGVRFIKKNVPLKIKTFLTVI